MDQLLHFGLIFISFIVSTTVSATSIGDLIFTPDWVQVGANERANYYIDRTSIHSPNRHLKHSVKFKYLINLNSRTPQGARSVILVVNYDCRKKLLYTNGVSIFRSEMGQDLIDGAEGNVPIKLNQSSISLICNR